MKRKIMMMLCLALLLSSCTIKVDERELIDTNRENYSETSGGTAESQDKDTAEVVIEESEAVSQERVAFEQSLKEMLYYKGYYSEQVNQPDVDAVLFEIELPLTPLKIDQVEDEHIREILSALIEAGYVVVDEGEYFDVDLDYGKLMEISRNIEGAGRDYVELSYYNNVFKDKLKNLTPVNLDEFTAMLIRSEMHFEKWPKSDFKSEMNALYKEQLMFYFLGDSYHQVFDYASNKLKEESLDRMKKHMQLYNTSYFSKLGVKYLIALEDNEYAYHPEYIQLIDNYKRFGLDSDLVLTEQKVLDTKQSIFLPELKGHSNITIQESINAILRDEVARIKQEAGYSDESEGVFYFNTYIYLSTRNLLSLECIGSHNKSDWTQDQSVTKTFTFNLMTGEPMTLDRLMEQDIKTLNAWMLPLVNDEFEKYFGVSGYLDTLEGVGFVLQRDAIQVIGDDPTYRVYIPRWILNEHIDVKRIFRE
jgi:hypothetical protein